MINTQTADERATRRASRIFRGAAIYGLLVLPLMLIVPLPQRGPEVRLGFVGLALVFQWLFWIIGGDPHRYWRLMLPAMAEKLVFALPALIFAAQGRTDLSVTPFAVIDMALAAMFLFARQGLQTANRFIGA